MEIKVYQGEDPDALKNVEIGTFLFSGLNRRQGAHAQGILFTYSLDLDGLLHVHARERATGREIRGVVENAIGRSSDEALGAARERVSALWGVEGEQGAEAAGDAAAESSGEPGPAPAAVPLDVAHDVRDTLARAEQALEAAPAEDREEMINLTSRTVVCGRSPGSAFPGSAPRSQPPNRSSATPRPDTSARSWTTCCMSALRMPFANCSRRAADAAPAHRPVPVLRGRPAAAGATDCARRLLLATPGLVRPLPDADLMPEELRAAIVLFASLLDERQRRLFAGLESLNSPWKKSVR